MLLLLRHAPCHLPWPVARFNAEQQQWNAKHDEWERAHLRHKEELEHVRQGALLQGRKDAALAVAEAEAKASAERANMERCEALCCKGWVGTIGAATILNQVRAQSRGRMTLHLWLPVLMLLVVDT
jgi:hypothetical protein